MKNINAPVFIADIIFLPHFSGSQGLEERVNLDSFLIKSLPQRQTLSDFNLCCSTLKEQYLREKYKLSTLNNSQELFVLISILTVLSPPRSGPIFQGSLLHLSFMNE